MKIRQEISYILFAVIVSVSIFSFVYPAPKVYLILTESIWVWVLLNYGSECNKKLLWRLLELYFGNGVSYLLILQTKQIFPVQLDWFECCLVLFYVLCGCWSLYYLVKEPLSYLSEADKEKIYPAREYDLQRVLGKVQEVSIVGINAGWGNGKSFLTDRLLQKPEIREGYEVIRIDLLVCNLDRIESILLEELNRLLQKHRIYTFSSQRLQRLLQTVPNTDWLSGLYPVKSSISESFQELKDALTHIPGKILIIYEDIDRIQDKTVLKNIFAISEKLADTQIHILYQYDEHNLEEAGLSREYLEKYIPYVVNLTEITYREMIRMQWEEIQMPECISQDKILQLPEHPFYDFLLKKVLKLELHGSVKFCNLSIRKVKLFLNEVRQYVLENEAYKKEENMEILIRALFVKNFFYRYFKQLEFGKSFSETLLFRINDREYTLQELIRFGLKKEHGEIEVSSEEIRKAFEENGENKEKLYLLLFLGYRTTKYMQKKEIYQDQERNDSDFKIIERNEKIDRILWNVSSNGKSEYTNLENAVDEFQDTVLSVSPDIRQEKLSAYMKSMYHEDLRKDNRTIFLMGESYFVALFRGYYILNKSAGEWMQLIEFYFSQKENRTISLKMLEAFRYVQLEDKTLYLFIISRVRECEILGNMKRVPLFLDFLKKYIQPVFLFGYLQDYSFGEALECSSWDPEEMLQGIRNRLLETEESRDLWHLEEIQEEIKEIICFIDYMLQIISMEKVYKQSPACNTSITTKWIHQEEIEQLIALAQADEERYEKELVISYRQGKLFPAEVAVIRKKLEQKRGIRKQNHQKRY